MLLEHLNKGVTSKKHPHSSLDQYLTDWATPWYIGSVYNIQDEFRSWMLIFEIDQTCEFAGQCKLLVSLW